MRARARATQKTSDDRFGWPADLAPLQGWWRLCAESGHAQNYRGPGRFNRESTGAHVTGLGGNLGFDYFLTGSKPAYE